jgi:hypothetical protein
MKTNVLLYFASTDDNLLTPQNELATAIRCRSNMLEGCRFSLGAAARAAGREDAGGEFESPDLDLAARP